jgi:hypothetical protein
MLKAALRTAALLLLAGLTLARIAPELPILAADDFESAGAVRWRPCDPARWRIAEGEGGRFYELTAPGPAGKIRAPTSWSVIETDGLSEFVLTGRFRCYTDPANDKRDLCVIFGFRDPEHFSYVHFSASSDGVHNIIGRVDGSDRVKVNREPEGRSVFRLKDRAWHAFKVTRDAAGRIAAYIDDMAAPVLTADDAAMPPGRVGVGSFDDTGAFDDIVLRGRSR